MTRDAATPSAGERVAARAVHEALAAATPDAPEALAAAGRRLLADPWWVAPLLSPWIDALAGDPWFAPPLRAARDPLRTSAILAEGPHALLIATTVSADTLRARPPATTLIVSGRLAVTRYHRAGGATLLAWDTGVAGADFAAAGAPRAVALPPQALADGAIVTLDGRRHAHLVEGASADLVTLTVAPRAVAGDAGMTREYDRGTGALLRVAGNDEAGSRTRMLLTLLRLSQRRDAAPCFDAATRHPAFHLRWAAMREWLALDAAAAATRLRAMARDDPNAEVGAAAAATLPLLEVAPCPA